MLPWQRLYRIECMRRIQHVALRVKRQRDKTTHAHHHVSYCSLLLRCDLRCHPCYSILLSGALCFLMLLMPAGDHVGSACGHSGEIQGAHPGNQGPREGTPGRSGGTRGHFRLSGGTLGATPANFWEIGSRSGGGANRPGSTPQNRPSRVLHGVKWEHSNICIYIYIYTVTLHIETVSGELMPRQEERSRESAPNMLLSHHLTTQRKWGMRA